MPVFVPKNFYIRPRPAQSGGVTVNEPGAYNGVTFVTGLFDDWLGMRLIAMDGSVLHEWRASISEIWPDPEHLEGARTDWETHVHGTHLYPNGDVVFNFQYAGLVRIDACSTVEWKLPELTHHSVFEDGQGNLWVPSRREVDGTDNSLPKLRLPYIEDLILKVSPHGQVLEEISILDVIYQANYEGLLSGNGLHQSSILMPNDGDLTHLNDIEILDTSMADAFPQFQAGDIMISMRNLNLIMVLDAVTARDQMVDDRPACSPTRPGLFAHRSDLGLRQPARRARRRCVRR